MPCGCCNNNNNRCRRIAVRVDRIFNAARREQSVSSTLTLSDFTPPNPTPPLTYINSGFTGEATVDAVSVLPVAGCCKNRVTIDYSFPVTVNYTDAGGNFGRASAVLNDTIDLLLAMPTCPYTVEVEAVLSSRFGTIDGDTASITGCLLTIVRIMVKSDIIIENPCFVNYPPAALTEDDVCEGVFSNA